MFQHQNIAVIGGSSGIGRAVVERLSASGGRVYHFSRADGMPPELGVASHRRYDALSDPFPVADLPDRLDGLVYCPGSIRLRPVSRLTAEDFLADFQINLIGAVNAVKGCLTRLKKARNGASIVLFSTVAVQTGMPFHASVASSKGAVEGLTRSLAAEFAPRIRVNAVAPSLTDTPLAGDLLADENRRKASAERHPLRRIGSPREIADAVLFLLGTPSSWMTGQVLEVDGGMGSVRVFR